MALRAGFIGLGNIGKPLAQHFAPAGFETALYDINPAPAAELAALHKRARAVESARECGAGADFIGICVPQDEQVLDAAKPALSDAKAGAVLAIISTILPRTAEAVAAFAESRGCHVLDACVTGGAARAQQRAVTYLVGGAAEALAKARPFLECNSANIIHAGELGSGAKLKLAVNVLTYLQWAAAYEAYKLATASGLDGEIFEEAVRANGQLTELQQQYLVLHKLPEDARRSDAVQKINRGHMHIAEKDLAWALQLARENGLALPVAGQVSQSMARLYGVEDAGRR